MKKRKPLSEITRKKISETKLSQHNGGEKHWNWQGGRAKHSAGYVLVLLPMHPRSSSNGYVYEHIIIWENHYGKIPEGYQIHHKNGIKNDNRIENLQLVSYLEHKQFHSNGCWKNLPLDKILRFYHSGLSPITIAKMISVDKSTIYKRLNLYAGCNYAI
jgi:hypothetical protein